MRNFKRRPLHLGLFALAVSVGTASSAQTTFRSSNNPAAALSVERVAPSGTVLRIRQRRGSMAYFPLSQNTVLRDPATGISYPLRGLDSEVLPKGDVEVVTLRFSPFSESVPTFELLDPERPAQALYFKGVRLAAPDEITAAKE